MKNIRTKSKKAKRQKGKKGKKTKRQKDINHWKPLPEDRGNWTRSCSYLSSRNQLEFISSEKFTKDSSIAWSVLPLVMVRVTSAKSQNHQSCDLVRFPELVSRGIWLITTHRSDPQVHRLNNKEIKKPFQPWEQQLFEGVRPIWEQVLLKKISN